MLKKTLGYIVSAIGIAVLVIFSIQPIRTALKIPATQSDNIFVIIGLVIVGIGLIISYSSSSSKKIHEVPIYHGDKVVGYRRMHKQ